MLLGCKKKHLHLPRAETLTHRRSNIPEVNRHGLHNVSEALDLLHPSDSKDAVEELDRVDGDADNVDDFQKEDPRAEDDEARLARSH